LNTPGPLERAFVCVVAVSICASSWLLGSSLLWTQWVMLALCGLACVTGIWLYASRRDAVAATFRPWIGWMASGLALATFVAFVGIQSVNVSHIPVLETNNCTLIPVEHWRFLPSSIGGPFNGLANGFIPTENAARYLLNYSAAALGILAVMFGVQSRWSLRILILVLAVHGLVSGAICLAHQWSGSTKVLWIRGDPLMFLGAPFFVYKNQNAAYQTLLTGWILGWWAAVSARSTVRPTWLGPAVFVMAEIGLASIRSRAGMLFAGVLGVAWVLHQRHALRQWWRDRRLIMIVVLLVSVGAAGMALSETGGLDTLRRFSAETDLLRVGPHGGKMRMLEHQVALKMFSDRPWLGWGAGSYLYNYSGYDAAVPEMASIRSGYSYYLLSPHADGDWYEFLAEFGVIGTSLFLFIWLPHLIWWVRTRAWADPAVLMPALAVGLVLVHGFIDSAFRNLAVLLVLGVSTALVTKSLSLRNQSEDVPADRRLHAVRATTSRSVRLTGGMSAWWREMRWW
jgi:hypothetical protein